MDCATIMLKVMVCPGLFLVGPGGYRSKSINYEQHYLKIRHKYITRTSSGCVVIVQASTTGLLLPRQQAEYTDALQDLERSAARANQLYREVRI